MIGESDVFVRVREIIKRAGPTNSTVLITGESGTGKEVAARALHACSGRMQGPFVAINCAAIPENLLESELFGYKKGAFTGAVSDRAGLFKRADGGTVFLDEIGAMPLGLQAKLLRVLQEREVLPLGGHTPEKVDPRFLAATNEKLKELVVRGAFREDLYFRLNVIPLRIAPLRERPGDIPLLLAHFLATYCQGSNPPRFSSEAMARLSAYGWPGNIRQLENTVQYCLTMGGMDLDVGDLPPDVRGELPEPNAIQDWLEPALNGLGLETALARYEAHLIRTALARSGGVKTKAALALGIKRTTLIEKIRRLERRGMLGDKKAD